MPDDEWVPWEAGWKAYIEDRLGRPDMGHAILETRCPDCEKPVGALIRGDGEPWLNVTCPLCEHNWTEHK